MEPDASGDNTKTERRSLPEVTYLLVGEPSFNEGLLPPTLLQPSRFSLSGAWRVSQLFISTQGQVLSYAEPSRKMTSLDNIVSGANDSGREMIISLTPFL